jgi:hypothetical protein
LKRRTADGKILLELIARGVAEIHQDNVGCKFRNPGKQTLATADNGNLASFERSETVLDYRSSRCTVIDDRNPHRRLLHCTIHREQAPTRVF